MAMTTIGMAAAGAFDWVREAAFPGIVAAPNYLLLIWYFISFFTAVAALFLIMFLQIPYMVAVRKSGPGDTTRLEIWRFILINLLGGLALFVSLLFLI